MSEDLLVPPNSTVYIPPTQLAKAGRLVDQVFRQIIMYNGISIGFDPFLSPRGIYAP
jgi:polysaccharide export outer membrane protein